MKKFGQKVSECICQVERLGAKLRGSYNLSALDSICAGQERPGIMPLLIAFPVTVSVHPDL